MIDSRVLQIEPRKWTVQFWVIFLLGWLVLLAFADYLLTPRQIADITNRYARTIIALSDRNTGIPPSHYGSPGYEDLTYTYDASVSAMLLKQAGKQAEAEKIIDYFVQRLSIPLSEVRQNRDANGVYGILKLGGDGLNIINAIDRTSIKRQGRGQLEFLTTPGPCMWIIMGMLDVNASKYRDDALLLGNALLAMQRPDGGVFDGNRSPGRVHTEPHVDALDIFYQLFQLTGDQKWKQAGDKAADWFMKNVYNPRLGEIYQGIWENGPSTIFATDCYSWTMASFMGDRFSLNDLDRLTQTMLSRSLVRITLELPGGRTQTMVSVDFTDARDPRVMRVRRGFHPIGSPEWTGGVILALQKNAVRFWDAGDKEKAGYYKEIAEFLTAEWLKAGYDVRGLRMFSYATGQGLAVGHGWNTPFFYVKGPNSVEGGSIVGGWPILPINGKNPLIYNDDYFRTYQQISVSTNAQETASRDVNEMLAGKTFRETGPAQSLDPRATIVEPGNFNRSAWAAFDRGDYRQAIVWAQKVTSEPDWGRLARIEQKTKAKVIGGIIYYPWGTIYPDNEAPVHTAIWKYPLLNEATAAMWILVTSNFELGNRDQAKKWIRRIIEEVRLGQIANVVDNPQTGKKDLIDGYWNPIISWEYPSNPRDIGVAVLYQEVLREKGIPGITLQQIPLYQIIGADPFPMANDLSGGSLSIKAYSPTVEQSSTLPPASVAGPGILRLCIILALIIGGLALMIYFLNRRLSGSRKELER